MNMRILVTFAVEAEFAPWRKLRKFNRIDYEDLRLYRAKIADSEITVLLTGMGNQAAARAMDLMMKMADEDKYFDVCISSGLAGALHPSLVPGDIIAPRVVRAEFQHADVQSDSIAVDQDLHKMGFEQGAKCTDCLFTTDRVLLKAKEKQECSSKAQSVDMESFEIVKEACAWGARSVVIRAVSDAFDEDLPIDFNRTLSKDSQVSVTKVVLQVMKNPFVLPALLRFGKQSRMAAEELAKYLDKYVSTVPETQSLAASRAEAAAR
jgi:adenosylhomocysteine nucleosidase